MGILGRFLFESCKIVCALKNVFSMSSFIMCLIRMCYCYDEVLGYLL